MKEKRAFEKSKYMKGNSNSKKKINAFLKKILYIIYLPVIILIFLEIGVRIWGYSGHYISDPIYRPFDNAEDIPYIHKPNLVNARARGLSIINTDSLGLRSKTAGVKYNRKKDNEYRITIVGDSVTFGEGIKRNEDIFSQVLEDNLNQKQSVVKVKVFNYAASAYSVKEMVATFKYRMIDLEPDLALMAIIPDDFDLSRVAGVDKWGYSVNYKMSGFVSKDSVIKRLLRKVHLTYVLRDIHYRWLNKKQNMSDESSRVELPESYEYIKQFKETSEEFHVPYGIVLLPTVNNRFTNLISEQLDKDNITFVDLTSIGNEFTADQFMASKFDGHPSYLVHRKIGEILAAYIMQNLLRISTRWNLKTERNNEF